MGNTDIISDIDTPAIIKVTTKINDSILSHTHLTNMKELTSSMDTRLASPDSNSEQTQIPISERIRYQ